MVRFGAKSPACSEFGDGLMVGQNFAHMLFSIRQGSSL